MANYTNLTALTALVAFAREHGCEDADLLAKGDVMVAAQKKRVENAKNAPRAKSKEQIERENNAARVVEVMRDHGEPVSAAWIVEHCPTVYTESGANGVMRTAKRLGLVETCGTVKNAAGKQRTLYKAL